MIRTDYSAGRDRFELQGVEDSRSQVIAAVKAEERAIATEIQRLSTERGTPARMGELNAGTDMLKARLLSQTADIDALSNGEITTAFPPGGDNGQPHTIYINGINGDPEGTLGEAQRIANLTGAPVDRIYQQSSIANVALREAAVLAARIAILGPFGGFGVTLARARADLMKKLENPQAAATAANQIIRQLGSPDSSTEVRLVGYSQGATISAQALRLVNQQLSQRYGAATAEKMMSRVNVLSVGGAARRTDFPKGVQLTQLYNKYDVVSQFFGDNRTPLFQSLRLGKDILKPHSYFNDQAALNVIAQWQQGRLGNEDIMLMDPKLRKAGDPAVLRRVPFGPTQGIAAAASV